MIWFLHLRKSALQLLSVIGRLQQQEPTAETLQQLKDRCRDAALSIRKQSMTCLTEFVQSFPSSTKAITTWASTVPCMIADTEQSIQEKTVEYFEQIVLNRVRNWQSVESGDPALWILLSKLDFGADVANATRRILVRIQKKSGVPKKIVPALQAAVESEEYPMLAKLRVKGSSVQD